MLRDWLDWVCFALTFVGILVLMVAALAVMVGAFVLGVLVVVAATT